MLHVCLSNNIYVFNNLKLTSFQRLKPSSYLKSQIEKLSCLFMFQSHLEDNIETIEKNKYVGPGKLHYNQTNMNCLEVIAQSFGFLPKLCTFLKKYIPVVCALNEESIHW
jgi:hypothetical protein